MSLECLLEAARIVEQRELNNHQLSYPISSQNHHHPHLLSSSSSRKDRRFVKRSQTYRATHNQLEKNRRKHLRDCLNALRDLVPTSPDTSKVTTLDLLQGAKQYIKVLESHDREAQIVKRRLCLKQQRLRKELSSLLNSYRNGGGGPNNNNNKSVTSSVTSSVSSGEEEIDVENDDETGYGSGEDSSLSSTSSNTSLNSVL